MKSKTWRWVLGLIYILAVATIWIAASFVVQSVVDGGVSPFLITYICNSLFVIYIPLVEIGRYLEDNYGGLLFWRSKDDSGSVGLQESEVATLLVENNGGVQTNGLNFGTAETVTHSDDVVLDEDGSGELDAKGRWTRKRLAKVSLLICPFWFFAQLSFNLSLKYTTVTNRNRQSNTILSSSSSLFTFLVSLAFLGEKFTWIKLFSVLLCMGGTIIVSLGDSETGKSATAPNPAIGDILALVSSAFYAVYITLIRKKLPDEDEDAKTGKVSMAQFLGFLGLFNLLIFSPIALILHLANLEPFDTISRKQFGLIVGKGLLDNVLSDYLWAKAVILTTTTVATAGLTIQVPLAAIVDTVIGNAPGFMDYIGAAAVMVGFAGINIPISATCSTTKESALELEENHTNDRNTLSIADVNHQVQP